MSYMGLFHGHSWRFSRKQTSPFWVPQSSRNFTCIQTPKGFMAFEYKSNEEDLCCKPASIYKLHVDDSNCQVAG